MTNNLQIKSILPIANGLFAAMENSTRYTVPWEKGQPLDTMYVMQHSGEKISSPLLRNLADNIPALADTILMMYNDNWTKVYNAWNTEYEPLENYRMIETEHSDNTDNTTTNGTNKTDYGRIEDNTNTTAYGKTETGNGTTTYGGTENTSTVTEYGKTTDRTTDNHAEQTNAVWGFNSDTSVNSDNQNGTNGGTEHTADSGKDTTTTDVTHGGSDTQNNTVTTGGTDKLTGKTTLSGNDTVTENSTSNGTSTNDRNLTRSGNIGITTSQQMLESELQLRQWNFFNSVFADVDKIISLKIY